jgi:glutathione synthase/RimK-type ligase-like ATP-grasp enzyme
MRFAVVAHRESETNVALAEAAKRLGLDAELLRPRDALRLLDTGDVALARLDVREGLDGIESGTPELESLAAAGVEVLNPPRAIVAAHDKLLTARALRLAALPHPHTSLIAAGVPAAAPELPVVLKPRFGSWGRDVVLCPTADAFELALANLAFRDWFHEHGVLAQELVPPQGWDLRVLVAGGRVVGAAKRVAAPGAQPPQIRRHRGRGHGHSASSSMSAPPGEWRTNVSLGGRSEPAEPPALAQSLALAAAAAIGGDLVGVDLLPTRHGFVVAELNGAVDVRASYALGLESVYTEAVQRLLHVARERVATRAASA